MKYLASAIAAFLFATEVAKITSEAFGPIIEMVGLVSNR